jgi:hypothetical protein
MDKHLSILMHWSSKAVVSVLCLVFLVSAVACSRDTENVIVTNPETDPLPVMNVNEQEIQVFQESFLLQLPDGQAAGTLIEELPEGKMLVIENASAIVSLPAGQKTIRVGIKTEIAGSGLVEHFFPTRFQGSSTTPRDIFTAGQLTRLYSVGQVVFALQRSDFSETASAEIAISGYLTDAD